MEFSRTSVTVAATLCLLAGGAAPAPPNDGGILGLAPARPNQHASQTLSWSPDLFGTFTHSGAVQAAAAYTGGGFTDWRLPSLEELTAAVTDADPGTFGQSDVAGSNPWYWSSKKQGSAWAFAVEVYTDGSGYPIPSLSGRSIKTPSRSTHRVKCVRP